ncbi:MAG: carbamoyltransferase HypF [Tannerellaceae bacterium]|jgi:hydrogenase maturation protein HypF|nr:carbamoyltransferase HypF [Tannerellaceae bacterium]
MNHLLPKIIRIRGLVQGVGFRPFIYRIALEEGIKGEVENHPDGVTVRAVFASEEALNRFLFRIRNEHPPVASIHSIEHLPLSTSTSHAYDAFTIAPSQGEANEVTQVAPDIAVCPECMNDRMTQPHRLHYPFINCMHCGPRFSILRDLPYDRSQTTMQPFRMCSRCREEYEQVTNRRFHAQPIACHHCGPSYYAVYREINYTDYRDLLLLTSRLLRRGEVIAAKGIGGYHLVCDARNEQAVERLRSIKARDTKPFAVMFRNLDALKDYAVANETEASCLASRRRPIVLLEQRRPLARALNPGMRTLGVMLPYMPIHFDWLDRLDTPALVMTSGNRNDCPIARTEAEAVEQFGGEVALILHHTREIYNRVDDSVLHVCGHLPRLIRRSRGYAPEPFFADASVDGLLAFGAEQANTFALGKGETILQSQHIGDLKNWETFRFYAESLERFGRLFRFQPRRLACDLHPDYLSSREAERWASAYALPLLRVQHHHAHAVACMAEYGLHRPVLAIVMDGTGWGDDGHIWGGEFLLCDRQRYRRLAHLEYLPMPGGDKASVEPWRMAVACLYAWNLPLPDDFTSRIGKERIAAIERMIAGRLCTPLTSSAGRMFDAVASLLGLCDVSTHQAQAPVLLEHAAAGFASALPYPMEEAEGEAVSLRPVVEALLRDKREGRLPVGHLAARFHATLAKILAEKTRQLMLQTGASEVVLSGGCFQNKLLAALLAEIFARQAIPLYIPSRIPCNDGGISVGQLIVASQTVTTRLPG